MGIFGTSSPFDQDVEKATSENNTSEEWGLILEICDRAGGSAASSKECLRAVLRRLAHPDPHVQVQAATLLDACVANCGRTFHLEVASRDFEAEFRRLVARAQPPVAARLRQLLRKWAENEFKDDPQLDLVVALHARLRADDEAGAAAATAPAAAVAPAAAAAAAAQREQDELARAIALSLREAGPAPGPGPGAAPPPAGALYPRVDGSPPPAPAPAPAPARKVRALYDFEAAEDNELTFLAGEIVHVTDSSDPNWWKGHNERGEGLFPANFVTADLSEPPPPPPQPQPESEARVAAAGKSVQFAAEVGGGGGRAGSPPLEIDEGAMDEALALLLEADPERGAGVGAGVGGADEARLAALEARVAGMGPLIDAALQRADRRHARLTQLSADLVDALNLYHHLMREPRDVALYAPPPSAHPAPGARPPHTPHLAPHHPHLYAPPAPPAAHPAHPAHPAQPRC